jgi:stage V sporulation protein B
VGAIVIGVVLYLILVLRLHIISREDLSLMPKGEKFAKILRLK